MEIDFGKCPDCGGIKKCVASLEKNHDICHSENQTEHKELWGAVNSKLSTKTGTWILALLVTIAIAAVGFQFTMLEKISIKVSNIAEKQAYAQGIQDRKTEKP